MSYVNLFFLEKETLEIKMNSLEKKLWVTVYMSFFFKDAHFWGIQKIKDHIIYQLYHKTPTFITNLSSIYFFYDVFIIKLWSV